jgi:hypothetical protein
VTSKSTLLFQSLDTMRFPTSAATLALILGVSGNPVSLAGRSATPCGAYERAAFFEMWTTECEVGSGHTWGTKDVERAWTNLCFPLPDDTHALKLTELADDCRSMSLISILIYS